MWNSILPFYLVIVFAIGIGIAHRAAAGGALTRQEIRRVDMLIGALFIWTLICTAMGIEGLHISPTLRAKVPFLWQATVPVLIVAVGLLGSPRLRRALTAIAAFTPLEWFVWFQVLRIGALGGVLKGMQGQIDSSYVFWVGLPDLLYGLSALALGGLLRFRDVRPQTLLIWNLVGPAIILMPTFGFMSAFMNEPGFLFIFAFPMVLAPGIVVPFLLLLNGMAAWKLWGILQERSQTDTTVRAAHQARH